MPLPVELGTVHRVLFHAQPKWEFRDGHVSAAGHSSLGCSVLAPVPPVSLKAGS